MLEEPRATLPIGRLERLSTLQLRVNPTNPRRLFDPGPLEDLKENIRGHGVLVPLTVFPIPGQDVYEILDGQRRFQCCQDLEKEGLKVEIPANVVDPPSKIAGLLYMFNIHNYREPWELMPTALSLKVVMDRLGTTDTKKLAHLTGLNEKSVERCKILLDVPDEYQELSLDPNPADRIPSNFWIEAKPVVDIVQTQLPDLYLEYEEHGILDRLVAKYRKRKIRSVIHFRRIVEAYEVATAARDQVLTSLRAYIVDEDLETRATFDPFVVDSRRVESALKACNDFISSITAAKLDHLTDERDEIRSALEQVRATVAALLISLEGSDPPDVEHESNPIDETDSAS